MLDVETALGALEEAVSVPQGQVAVIKADWARAVGALGRPWPLLAELAQAAPAPVSWQARLKEELSERRGAVLTGYVRAAVAEVLGLVPEELPDQTGFFELGMDSLMTVELRNRLQTNLGGEPLSPTVVLDYPTTEALTRHLATKVLAQPAERSGNEPGPIDSSGSLDQLSADDLLALMEKEAGRILRGEDPS